MSLPLLLTLALMAGIVLISAGLALPLLGRRQLMRRQILLRLAAAGDTESDAARGPALRLDDGGRRKFSLFGEVTAEGARERPFIAWFLAALFAVVLSAMVVLVTGSWAGMLAGLLAPPAVWLMWGSYREAKYRAAVDDSVPEAMQMIVRALRIGQPVGFAIHGAGRDLTGPLAAEFTLTADRISYGQSVASALRDLAERCDNQNLRFLAAAVSIQSATGGNLADVLDRLAEIARGRQQMRRKISAIIAEARWSGRFLSAFPLIATGLVLLINPAHFEDIQGLDFFKPLLAIVGALLVLNLLYMRWLVQVE
ncbi:type II secretion system F family protein [Falsigemmobacter faecalis]|uniref:Type II secretion system protein GspF domain-containing protein n=1 Tax=Falsigemmobacter faecalis TaxID=2488730 RepID=A0A3P3DT87_9RHOB|nr:type II secretion system F family protein [Falsigemmobacter faecalis]RRH76906.1 hypothetical protein EG244_04670 [Falsigemmobacter faecalis]